MASQQQMTGMRGVYLVAAELSRLGFIASPTSRSAAGADILVTDQSCQNTYSIQVKTNARTFNFWLLSKYASEHVYSNHIYVLVNIRKIKEGEEIEYYVVPSKVVVKNMRITERANSEWYSVNISDIDNYQNKWDVLG